MEHRQLGQAGPQVPVLSFGTATFGGLGDFYRQWGATDVAQARRLIDICIEAGANFFDTADSYSQGLSEEILGQALAGRRNAAIISSKMALPMGDGPDDFGTSRKRVVESCEASLKRLGTDHIEVYFMHSFDAMTPVEETLRGIEDLIASGKIGHAGVSNFSGWQVMKALAAADREQLSRYVAYQGYYSLIGREYEWDLMPLAVDQGIGLMAWSPLGWGRLTGRIRRGEQATSGRIAEGRGAYGPPIDDEHVYDVVDELDRIAEETGKSVSQVALNWLLCRPTVANVVVGARTEQQLRENLGATGWRLSDEQIGRLDAVSHREPIYPYWHQRHFPQLTPQPTPW